MGKEIREATIEINPEDPVDFSFLRELGFDRVSLAAISFKEEFLRALGRGHLPSQVEKRVEEAKQAGFSNINLDLIFGIEGQTLKKLEEDLRKAVFLAPSHISLYLLEAPRYFSMNPPKDEMLEKMYFLAVEFLESHGLFQYEVSNFSRKGMESLHNLKYWRFENWIGLGPSAASHLGTKRWENKRSLRSYIGRLERGEGLERKVYFLSPEEELKERVMMGLRLVEGIRLCGSSLEEDIILKARQYPEFFEVQGCRLKIRRKYFFVMNSVLSLII